MEMSIEKAFAVKILWRESAKGTQRQISLFLLLILPYQTIKIEWRMRNERTK